MGESAGRGNGDQLLGSLCAVRVGDLPAESPWGSGACPGPERREPQGRDLPEARLGQKGGRGGSSGDAPQTSWRGFGSIIDIMSQNHGGTESRAPGRRGHTPSQILTLPVSSLLGAHKGPWRPGPTSSPCVLREDQEQDLWPQQSQLQAQVSA